jgi:hypothetical protein
MGIDVADLLLSQRTNGTISGDDKHILLSPDAKATSTMLFRLSCPYRCVMGGLLIDLACDRAKPAAA